MEKVVKWLAGVFVLISHLFGDQRNMSVAQQQVCMCMRVYKCMRWSVAIIVIVQKTEVSISRMHICKWVRVWSLAVPWKFSSAFLSCICFGGVFGSISTSSQMCVTRPCACVCVCAVLCCGCTTMAHAMGYACLHAHFVCVSECLCA